MTDTRHGWHPSLSIRGMRFWLWLIAAWLVIFTCACITWFPYGALIVVLAFVGCCAYAHRHP
jgi:hypothetical protein